jgi:Aspartyl protease
LRARGDTMPPVKHQLLLPCLLLVAGGAAAPAPGEAIDTSAAPAAVTVPAVAPETVVPAVAPAPAPPGVDNGEITEIVIQATEPRYVAPTRRDQIGRIWAPVYINGKGPFRLVLDSGASRSGVTAKVVSALGMKPDETNPVRLHAATGNATVPTIHADTIEVGDLLVKDSKLPILADALGGADGILGNEGLDGRRVYIDFRHDLIVISLSQGHPAAPGFMTVPFQLEHGRLLITDVQLGFVHAKAIIDTGGQITVANMALRDALMRRNSKEHFSVEQLEGVTNEIQNGEGRRAPPIRFGGIEIHTKRMIFADTRIFEYWKMTKEPAVMIGMDALGLLDTLIIDYRRHELMLRMRDDS